MFFFRFLSDFMAVLYTYSFPVDRSRNGHVTVSQPAFNVLSWCTIIDQDIKSNKGNSVLSYQVYEEDHKYRPTWTHYSQSLSSSSSFSFSSSSLRSEVPSSLT